MLVSKVIKMAKENGFVVELKNDVFGDKNVIYHPTSPKIQVEVSSDITKVDYYSIHNYHNSKWWVLRQKEDNILEVLFGEVK